MKILKRVNEVKSATYDEGRKEIRFESISGGFDINCDPFYMPGFTGDRYIDLVNFTTFSSGNTNYVKEIDPKILEEYKTAYKTEKTNKYHGNAIKESYKTISKDVLKVVNDFDKALEAVMKKHGYKKVNEVK